ncbi:MAG TPA: gamma-glutamyl-gamma-aminobutyrate hydrolase family protein, partial [Byssovorax sp.]
DGLLLSGSPCGVYERLDWMKPVADWALGAAADGTGVLGVCFGHQLLGQALGGSCVKNPNGREIGTRHIERVVDDPLFDGLDARFSANVTHVDSVVRAPRGAAVLAKSDLDPHHALRFSPTCYGVQFHPEIDGDVMRGYVEARRAILADEGFDVDAMLAAIDDAPAGRATLRNFVRHVVR